MCVGNLELPELDDKSDCGRVAVRRGILCCLLPAASPKRASQLLPNVPLQRKLNMFASQLSSVWIEGGKVYLRSVSVSLYLFGNGHNRIIVFRWILQSSSESFPSRYVSSVVRY
jgi:hypothetical protein